MLVVGGGAGLELDNDLAGYYISTSDTGSIHIGGDILEDAVIYIDGDLDELIVDGTIRGTVHVAGNLGLLRAAGITGDDDEMAAAMLTHGIVTVGGDINDIQVAGSITDALVLGGYDPGLDGGTIQQAIDGNLDWNLIDLDELRVNGTVDPNERVVAAQISTIQVGKLVSSVIAVSVSPGAADTDIRRYRCHRYGRGGDRADWYGAFHRMWKWTRPWAIMPFGIFAGTQIDTLRVDYAEQWQCRVGAGGAGKRVPGMGRGCRWRDRSR